jgi:hypothetical protein
MIGEILVMANRTNGNSSIWIDEIASRRVAGFDASLLTVITQLLVSTGGIGPVPIAQAPIVINPGQVLIDFVNLTMWPARTFTPFGQGIDTVTVVGSAARNALTGNYGEMTDTLAGLATDVAMTRVTGPLGDRFSGAWGSIWGDLMENVVRPSQVCEGSNQSTIACRR